MSTAAESPWSNGVVERHNAILENMVQKVIADTNCSFENALVWAVSAKNALGNNLGFSPNQLVFGRNPNLPSVLTSKPPALRNTTPSQLIAEHNALNAARKAFVENESSNKIKTALNRQTRTATSKEFFNGNHVYYKRYNSTEWHGPGKIIGINTNSNNFDIRAQYHVKNLMEDLLPLIKAQWERSNTQLKAPII